MSDPFFATHMVSYVGENMQTQFVLVLTNTDSESKCMIVLNTVINMIPVTGSLTGTIIPDGFTCNFALTNFVVTTPQGIPPIPVVSGTATLSDNGTVLTTSDILITFNGPQTIPAVVASCESVEPVANSLSQEDKSSALQTLHEEMLEQLLNE
jgi:hypothetical protein